jgi:hypothetical protein
MRGGEGIYLCHVTMLLSLRFVTITPLPRGDSSSSRFVQDLSASYTPYRFIINLKSRTYSIRAVSLLAFYTKNSDFFISL